MKKTLIKVFIVSFTVLFLPFLLTLLLSNKNHEKASIEAMDFTVYYGKDGKKEKLDFNQYIIGVVAANMPAGYELEALKAQAVIARTYALYNISLLREENPSKKEFLTSELGLSYIGLDEMEQYWGSEDYSNYFSKIENSVYSTENEILTCQNELILPVFFGTGSGFTRNASEAWGVELPYLVSVQSKQDVTSTNYLKITEFDVSDLISLLSQKYFGLTVTKENFFNEVQVTKRDSTGYVTEINLGSITVSGEEFAQLLGLNSNNFYIEEYEEKARIICTGIGHGVGLSQYGADAMAKEGYSYNEILSHYYTGVTLEKINTDN